MTVARLRSAGNLALAVGCAGVLGVASIHISELASGVRMLMAEAALLTNEGFIMGGTEIPDPSQEPGYISNVESLYLGQYTSSYDFHPLVTPEQFCPIVCLPAPNPDLTFGESVNQGVQTLDETIRPLLGDGDNVAVLGYSQSATVATEEMNNLLANPEGLTPVQLANLHVVLLGDPNSPIGGILDRFQFPDGLDGSPQHLPFLDVPLSLDPTPTTPFPTDIYTIEYDGYGSFPEDPSNILADLNALVGIETVHPFYPDPTAGIDIDPSQTINLGTIGDTTFHEISAPLPLLAFLQDGGPAGQFFYDALSPNLALNIDWAYGNPGDPFVGVNGTDAIGPWQVDATGQLMLSGVAGFVPKMDPLQMLAGAEYANVESFVKPIDDLLEAAGQSELPNSFVNSLFSGYDLTNQLDTSLLTTWTDLTASIPALSPDVIFDGAPLISGQPLIDLVGLGFDLFNMFGA